MQAEILFGLFVIFTKRSGKPNNDNKEIKNFSVNHSRRKLLVSRGPHSPGSRALNLLCSLSSAFNDMFPHKHAFTEKFPFPIPPIPGWDPDTNPWDDYLYPALKPKPKELMHNRGTSFVCPWNSSFFVSSFSLGALILRR